MHTLIPIGLLFLMTPITVFAHPGRTASDGCHYCRTNCESWGVTYDARHCHNNSYSQSSYYGEGSYYAENSYYSQNAYYSETSYYSESAYYSEAAYTVKILPETTQEEPQRETPAEPSTRITTTNTSVDTHTPIENKTSTGNASPLLVRIWQYVLHFWFK